MSEALTLHDAMANHEMNTFPGQPMGLTSSEWGAAGTVVTHASEYDDVQRIMSNDHFAPTRKFVIPAMTDEGREIEQGVKDTPLMVYMDAGAGGSERQKHDAYRSRLHDSMLPLATYEDIAEAALAKLFAAESDFAQRIRDGEPFDVAGSSRDLVRDVLMEGAGLIDVHGDEVSPSRLDILPGQTGTQQWDWLRSARTERDSALKLLDLRNLAISSTFYWMNLMNSSSSADRARFAETQNYLTRALRIQAERGTPADDTEQMARLLEVGAGVITLVTAGLDTAGNLTGSALDKLTRNGGGEWNRLHDSPDQVRPFIRDRLATDPPIHGWLRQAREQVTIGGHAFEAGDIALSLLGAANRDPKRGDRPSMAFGGPQKHNVHSCIGAALGQRLSEVIVGGYTRNVARATHIDGSEERDYTDAAFHGKTFSQATAEAA